MFILKQTLSFNSDTKQWYIFMCVCLCEYTLQVITLTIFWLGWLFVFVSIKSNSFDVKSDDFYLLKIWIYELLLINIKTKKCSTIHYFCSWTTLWVFKDTEHFQMKFLLSWFRNCCCWCQCGNFKKEWKSVIKICSKCCRSSFFKEYDRFRSFF